MIGQIALNISLWIYLILYLPQIIHNQKQNNLDGLSKWMHIMLYFAYSLDLIYGFATHLPWQYRTVSGTGWILLTIQHLQLTKHFKQKQQIFSAQSYYALLCLFFILVLYGITLHPMSHQKLNLLGYLAQTGFMIALIPQIIKSKQLQSAQAINLIYILLNFTLSFLDVVSAWKLDLGWPNKVGSLFILVLVSLLLLQYRRYPRVPPLSKNQMTNPDRRHHPSQVSQ